MKRLIMLMAVAASVVGLSGAGFAANKPADSAAATQEKVTGDVKTIPMHVRADVIDAKSRIVVTKRRDGVEVKNVLTPSTDIKQGSAVARLEDIKVGDYVSGSRKKVSETEYTVVKITKFGPKAAPKEAVTPAADTKPK